MERVGRIATLLALGLLLAACSGGTPPQVPSSSTASSSQSADPSPEVTSLPESILPSLDGLTYTTDSSAEAKMLAGLSAEYTDGALIRRIETTDGLVVGGVLVRRSRADPPKGEDQEALDSVAGFTHTTGADRATIRGTRTWTSTMDGGGLTGYAWSRGRDVTIVFASERDAARRLTETYLAAS